jgi:hypothetical protein
LTVLTDICNLMEHSEDNESKTQYFSTTEYSGGEMFGYTDTKPAEPKEPSKRPVIISVLCVLAFIAAGGGLLVSLSSLVDIMPDWYRPYALTMLGVTTAAYIGIWKMKLWGLYMLAISFIVSIVVNYSQGATSPVFLSVFHSGKMD